MTAEPVKIEQRKERAQIYLAPEDMKALAEYTRLHSTRFENASQAGAHLIRRALLTHVDEGQEALLLPSVRRTVQDAVKIELDNIRQDLLKTVSQEVRETARRETEDVVAKHTRALGNRVAALLVNAGKDAHTAARLARTLLEYDLESEERVEAYWQEAVLAAGKRYSRSQASPDGEGRS